MTSSAVRSAAGSGELADLAQLDAALSAARRAVAAVEPEQGAGELRGNASELLASIQAETQAAREAHAQAVADREMQDRLEEIRQQVGRLGGCRVALVHLPDEVAAALATDPIERVVAAYDGLIMHLG